MIRLPQRSTRTDTLFPYTTLFRANRAETAALLEPWIGSSVIDPELPLPALIDVTFDGTERGRAVQVRALLEKIAPHARVDEQTAWLDRKSTRLNSSH